MSGMPQRQLSHELRYLIDMAKRGGREVDLDKIRTLIADNPQGWHSAHVIHNLGIDRLLWLEMKDLIVIDSFKWWHDPEAYRVRT